MQRDPLKRPRDAAQAQAVGALVVEAFEHLAYAASELMMLPQEVFEAGGMLFLKPAAN